MILSSIVYFSPTGTTRKVLESIAQGVETSDFQTYDITLPDHKTKVFGNNDELVIIGAPVYHGRLPDDAVKRLRQFKSNGTPAVVVVVYGNRAYEDALLELKLLVEELGFNPIAGAAFIGEHSFSNNEKPISPNRPDHQDLDLAFEFGKSIKGKMTNQLVNLGCPQIPGNLPLKAGLEPSDAAPVTINENCIRCGMCAEICPVSAISLIDETVMTNNRECILCCACIKECPTQSRLMAEPNILNITNWLHESCKERKEPEIFL